MASTVTVTLDLADIGLIVRPDVEFSAVLRDRGRAAVDDHSILTGHPLTETTNAFGIATLDLIPTSQYIIGTGVYRFSIDDSIVFEAVVPDMDATVRELQSAGATPIPTPSSPPGQIGHFYTDSPPANPIPGLGLIRPSTGEWLYWDGSQYTLPTNMRPAGGGGILLSSPTTYDPSGPTLNLVTTDLPAIGDQVWLIMPTSLDRSADDLDVEVNATSHAQLMDRDGVVVKPRDLTPGRLYGTIRLYHPTLIEVLRILDPVGVRPQDFAIFRLGSDDDVITAAEIADAVMSMTDVLPTVPRTDAGHEAFGVPVSAPDIRLIFNTLTSTSNSLGAFNRQAAPVSIGGVDYKFWVSRSRLSPVTFAREKRVIADQY